MFKLVGEEASCHARFMHVVVSLVGTKPLPDILSTFLVCSTEYFTLSPRS